MTQRIFSVLDRIAHPTTSGNDLDNSVAALRRLLHGEMPSELLRTDPVDAAEIDHLRGKLNEKIASERKRAKQIKSLNTKLIQLQDALDRVKAPTAPREHYSYDAVIQAMVSRFGKHHGVPAALIERNSRLRNQGMSIGRITASGFQQWRKQDQYPAYVIEQIAEMSVDDLLPRGKWTDDERAYLVELYEADAHQSNRALAEACSHRFGRLVTECSIKGELNRLRQNGRVSPYRV